MKNVKYCCIKKKNNAKDLRELSAYNIVSFILLLFISLIILIIYFIDSLLTIKCCNIIKL